MSPYWRFTEQAEAEMKVGSKNKLHIRFLRIKYSQKRYFTRKKNILFTFFSLTPIRSINHISPEKLTTALTF